MGADCSDSSPLPPAPDPVVTDTGPPKAAAADAVPAEIVTAPPVPELPEPTASDSAPPAPPTAVPVLRIINPEGVFNVVPVPK